MKHPFEGNSRGSIEKGELDGALPRKTSEVKKQKDEKVGRGCGQRKRERDQK